MRFYRYICTILIALTLTACGSPQSAQAATNGQVVEFLLSQVRASGVALAGGKVYFYSPSTTTPKTVWTDRGKTTPAANPYTLDSNATAQVYGDGLYRIIIKNTNGSSNPANWTTVYDRDNISIKEPSDPLEYDVATYGSLAAAVAAIGDTRATLKFATDQTLSGDVTIPANIELIPVNQALITPNGYDLIISGSFNVGRQKVFNGPGGVYISGTVNPDWFGLIANSGSSFGAANLTALERAAAATTVGATLQIYPGNYAISGATDIWTITKNINVRGFGRSTTLVCYNTGAGSAVKFAVSENGGFTDVRNQNINDLNFLWGVGAATGYHIEVTDIGVGLIQQHNFTIEGCTTGSIKVGGTTSTNVVRNTISGSLNLLTAYDNQRILYNNFIGESTGVYFDVVEGTFAHLVQGNTFSTRDGAIKIQNGQQIKIRDNTFEQQLSANTDFYDSTVAVVGASYGSYGIEITGNNFGGGPYVGNSIYVLNALGTLIDNNRFQTTSETGIVIGSDATKTRVGYNEYTGTVPVVGGWISDAGNSTSGVSQPISKITFANGWNADASFVFKRDETGRVFLNGSMAGGTLTAGTLVCTLPAGFRPSADTYVNAPGAASTTKLLITASTGAVTIAVTTTVTTMYFDGVSFQAP